MSNCSEYQGLMAAAIYGPLPGADQARLESHLATCESCRHEEAQLKETAQLVGHSSEIADNQGDAFVSAVRRKLGAKTHRRLPLKKPVARKQAWVLPATAAAAVLLAAVAMFFLTRPKPTAQIEVAVQPAPPEQNKPFVLFPKPQPPEAPPVPVVPPTPAPIPKPEPPPTPPPAPAPLPEPPKPEPEPTPVTPPSRTVAVMATIESAGGEVAVQTEAGKVAAKADLGLIPGQELQTGSRSSHVVVKILDGTRIHLAGDTHLKLVDAHNFTLSRGALRAEVARQPAATPMIFATPTADARVLGTELVLFAGAESTRLEVRTGKVRLTRREDGASADVSAGQAATAPKAGAFAAKPGRAAQGLQALYLFHEGQGNIVHDVAGAGAPLDLRIAKGHSPWTPSGLQLEGNPMLRSEVPATRVFDACRRTQELTLEAWILPAKAELPFEGAILSLSTDVQDRNFALSQNTSGFDGAVRLSTTDAGGRPVLTTGKGVAETKLTHVVFTRDASGRERLYVNGVERTMRTRTGTFGSWNEKFHLFVANESFEERPWSGTLRLAAIYSQALPAADVVRNFKAGVE